MVYEKEERREYPTEYSAVWKELQQELEAKTDQLLKDVDRELESEYPSLKNRRDGNGFNMDKAVTELMLREIRAAQEDV